MSKKDLNNLYSILNQIEIARKTIEQLIENADANSNSQYDKSINALTKQLNDTKKLVQKEQKKNKSEKAVNNSLNQYDIAVQFQMEVCFLLLFY